MDRTHYVYHTFCIANNKNYIGVTHKPIESGYIGSGKLIVDAIKKYNKKLFTRIDLFSGTKEACSEKEKFYIAYFDANNRRDDFYNLRSGGYEGGMHNLVSIEKMIDGVKAAWQDKIIRAKYLDSFKHRDPEIYRVAALNRDIHGDKNGMYGKNHTKESKLKMSNNKTGIKPNLTNEQRDKMKEDIKKNKVMMGSKSILQKSRNRWAAVSKKFSGEPKVSDDLKMMHDFYSISDKMKTLSNADLLEYLKFRFRFLEEELNEGKNAIESRNAEEVCDSLIDLVVVAVGTLDLYGVDFKTAWNEVLKANMTKEVGIKASRPNPWGFPDLIKPSGWVGPTHVNNHGLLESAMTNE